MRLTDQEIMERVSATWPNTFPHPLVKDGQLLDNPAWLGYNVPTQEYCSAMMAKLRQEIEAIDDVIDKYEAK